MSCPRIDLSVANHFDNSLTPEQRQEHAEHLVVCEICRQEIAQLENIPGQLKRWHNESVPAWDSRAIMNPPKARRSLPRRHLGLRKLAQWAPLAASLVLAVAVLTQTRLAVSADGWSISFGANAPSSSLDTTQLNALLTAHAEAQQAATRQWVETALRTHGETTADNLYQWMNWMEQQRQQDVQRMEAGFRQLLDRDFQTVDSVRQLASYVMYQELP